ncbi:MAG: hypothetical protein HDS62_03645 [Bacteroidales bacterium]|nr:hypothetical protein [Bacteroidales bacterium]
MTIDDIKALIASDESRTLELKKSTGELKDGMHAACAFLNTDGGFVYVTFKRPTKYDSPTAQVPAKQDEEPLNHRPSNGQVHTNLAPSTTESAIEDSKSTTESTIETLMSSIEFTNGNTEHKIIGLLKLDGSLTIDQLYPLLKMSRKGVQKAIERLKDKGILYREGTTKGGRWIVRIQ